MNRRNSRQVIKPQSGKSKVIISTIIMTLILILVIFTIYILNNSNKNIKADNSQSNEMVIEGLGLFSFDPDTINTTRSDLYKEKEFSILDIVIYLDKEKNLDAEYSFDASLGSYILSSINGIQYWAYVAVDQSGEIIKTGFLTDEHKYDNKNDYMLINISKDDFQYAYGAGNQGEYTESANSDLLKISQKAIKQIIEGNADMNLVDELENAGYNIEIIDLIKNQIGVDLPKYRDGKYEGIADAHNGKIIVEVTIYEGKIIFIDVMSHEETAPKLADVFSIIPLNILKNQSTKEVDTITGATEASEGYIQAVDNALSKAIN